ncbi:MAG: Rrf2 family transcriptional regulator [Planctomycetes bacterium]|nr:Rrf2 family transcriptional regulator [Planctomycetota bacterium]
MKLSQSVAYALQSTLLLAKLSSNGPVSCNQLATAGKMPERFLLQILRKLVTRGVLKSTRGVAGGYMLRRPTSKISLLDLYEAVEGPIKPTKAPGRGLPTASRKRLHGALQNLAEGIQKQLHAVKISSL